MTNMQCKVYVRWLKWPVGYRPTAIPGMSSKSEFLFLRHLILAAALIPAGCAVVPTSVQEHSTMHSNVLHIGVHTKDDVQSILSAADRESQIKRIELDNGDRWIYFGPGREMNFVWIILSPGGSAGGAMQVGTLDFLDLGFNGSGTLADVRMEKNVGLSLTGGKVGHGIRIVDTYADLGGTMTVYYPSSKTEGTANMEIKPDTQNCRIYAFGSGGSVLGVPISISLDGAPGTSLVTRFFYADFDVAPGVHKVTATNYKYGDTLAGEHTIEIQCTDSKPIFIEYRITSIFRKGDIKQVESEVGMRNISERLLIGGAYSFY